MKGKLVAQMRKDNPGLMTVDAQRAVEMVFTALPGALEEHGRITIPGFGAFTRKFVDTRKVRNPRTGETSIQTAHHVIKFREAR